MKIMILECDGCKATENVSEYRVYTGKEMDPSGNGYNDIWDYKDFCDKCLKKYVEKYGSSVTIDKIKTM